MLDLDTISSAAFERRRQRSSALDDLRQRLNACDGVSENATLNSDC